MKQVFSSGKGEVEVFEVPVPGRMRDSVLVRNAFSIISAGTEGAEVSAHRGLLGIYEQARASRDKVTKVWNLYRTQGIRSTYEKVQEKLGDYKLMGYSCAGTVAEVDSEALPFRVGDRVACMGAGLANHAEYVVIPKNLAVVVPDGVSLEQASFAALGCIAMQGIRRLELSPGERICVVGLGLIGQICMRLLAALGYESYGIDINDARVAKAQEIGGISSSWSLGAIDSVAKVLEITDGQGMDGVIVCAATKSDDPVNLAFDLCRKRGRVSIVGDVGLGLKRKKMYRKEIELRLSCSYGPGRYDPEYEMAGHDYPFGFVRWTERRNLELFLRLLDSGALDIGSLISAKYAIDQAQDAYLSLKKGDADTYGLLFDYGSLQQDTEAIAAPRRTIQYPAATARHKAGLINVGIIGVGGHAKEIHIPNLKRLSDRFSIHGFASRSGSSAGVAAKRHGARMATSDYREILADDGIDAVLIATRHKTHAKMTMEALEAGKHVLVEKPLALTIEDARLIDAASAQKGLVVRVGFNRRFSPFLNAMKQAVGAEGMRIFTARVNPGNIGDHWSNTIEEGGRILGEAVHFFDLCNWFMGAEPEQVTAMYAGDCSPTNPNITFQARYPDGSCGQVVYTTLGDKSMGKEYFEAFGNGRSVKSDDYETLEAFGVKQSLGRANKGDKGHRAELEEFAAAVQGKSYAIEGADARAGLVATWMALSALVSAEKGIAVRLDV